MPQNILRFCIETAFGQIILNASDKGIVSLSLSSIAKAPGQQSPPQFSDLVRRLQAYFDGAPVSFIDDRLDIRTATPFQQKVWEAARLIPHGETRSYRWIAQQIGQPDAVRAVGQALGKNPLPIIVPCHRVIASDGSLGGYSGGIEMKRRLLRLEGAFLNKS